MTESRQRPRRGRPGASMEGGGINSGSRRNGSGPTLARLIAVRVLERVERVRAYADIALHHALSQTNLASADRALATEIVYGTLRWRGCIDYLLRGALDQDLSKLEPLVTTTLRIGAYQIYFCDRIPDNAAVDEAVRCARAVGAERATGLVNAVLRRLARERDTHSFPKLEDDALEHLMHALSLPRWLAERWIGEFGVERAVSLARACNVRPPLTVRCNRQRIGREALLAELLPAFPHAAACELSSDGIVLGRKGDPGRDAHFLAGQYTVQDEASQLVVELLDPQPADQILDVCAAPGTKTSGIAERLGEAGGVLALDRHSNRLNLVGRNARRLGLKGINTLVRDATRPLDDLPTAPGESPASDREPFDRVLVDAPCSGIGALRRNPDARWRVRAHDPAKLANVQQSILANAAQVVRPGGTLVYSTCTLMREENDEVIDEFLAQHDDYTLTPPSELPASLAKVLDKRGMLRCYPDLHDTDGFFAARLVRRS